MAARAPVRRAFAQAACLPHHDYAALRVPTASGSTAGPHDPGADADRQGSLRLEPSSFLICTATPVVWHVLCCAVLCVCAVICSRLSARLQRMLSVIFFNRRFVIVRKPTSPTPGQGPRSDHQGVAGGAHVSSLFFWWTVTTFCHSRLIANALLLLLLLC